MFRRLEQSHLVLRERPRFFRRCRFVWSASSPAERHSSVAEYPFNAACLAACDNIEAGASAGAVEVGGVSPGTDRDGAGAGVEGLSCRDRGSTPHEVRTRSRPTSAPIFRSARGASLGRREALCRDRTPAPRSQSMPGRDLAACDGVEAGASAGAVVDDRVRERAAAVQARV